ncbi:phospholipase A1-like isoform X2 [Anthonomus grandis grandis]|uniref:phospholipase A1-like isoform X2 n=1 Tax=Anthonomus grandis grandis TaxID=2921223 RepID=UPI002165C216|nr:phospholipase A1-like isoform X2 [Anthonomus grandis grandis]
MNIVTFLLSTGLNLLHVPFAENIRDERSGVSDSDEISSLSFFPFSLIRHTPACSTVNIPLGENNLKFSTLPRGFCTNCCPVKISRDVQFRLYNKEEQSGIPISPLNQKGAAKSAGVRPEWNTVIFIHGFSEISPGESGKAIVDAYLSRPENYNIILLDWAELASFPWYRVAVQNVKLVGKILKNFIKLYSQSGEIPLEKLHVIGFSLGCHVASVAGKELKRFKIPRITALDPAFPEFSLEDRSRRLVESDANYVDVIHTDAGIFGFPEPSGNADFYPNGGRALQPGCQPGYLAEQRIVYQWRAVIQEHGNYMLNQSEIQMLFQQLAAEIGKGLRTVVTLHSTPIWDLKITIHLANFILERGLSRHMV